MLFQDALNCVKLDIARRIRNGELTERGLARRLGISQAHMHNVLKGVRALTPELADRILVEFSTDLDAIVFPTVPKKYPKRATIQDVEVEDHFPRATSK